jgi:hypothetical protein
MMRTGLSVSTPNPAYLIVLKAKVVVVWYVAPGRRTVLGKLAWFGESG